MNRYQLIIRHPVGRTLIDGVLKDNDKIALDLMRAFNNGYSISVPLEWKIKILDRAVGNSSILLSNSET